MAQYTVTCTHCGREMTVQLYGPHAQREYALAHRQWMCDECRTAQRDTADTAAAAEAAAQGLPALTGTPRQIAWAESLRQQRQADLRDLLATTAIAQAVMAAIMSHTDAAWWIDHRHTSTRTMAQDAYRHIQDAQQSQDAQPVQDTQAEQDAQPAQDTQAEMTTTGGSVISISHDGIASVHHPRLSEIAYISHMRDDMPGQRHAHSLANTRLSPALARRVGHPHILCVIGAHTRRSYDLALEDAELAWLDAHWPLLPSTAERWQAAMPPSARAYTEWARQMARHQDDLETALADERRSSMPPCSPDIPRPIMDADGTAWLAIDRMASASTESDRAIIGRRAIQAVLTGTPLPAAYADARAALSAAVDRLVQRD